MSNLQQNPSHLLQNLTSLLSEFFNRVSREVPLTCGLKRLHGNDSASEIVIYISGFRTEQDDPKKYWRNWIKNNKNAVVYSWMWNSGSDELESFFNWPICRAKAEEAGIMLGQVLDRRATLQRLPSRVKLVGHSLGGAVVFHALLELYKRNRADIVSDAVILHGAFQATPDQVNSAAKMISGSLIHVYSQEDLALKGFKFLHGRALGSHPIMFTVENTCHVVNVENPLKGDQVFSLNHDCRDQQISKLVSRNLKMGWFGFVLYLLAIFVVYIIILIYEQDFYAGLMWCLILSLEKKVGIYNCGI